MMRITAQLLETTMRNQRLRMLPILFLIVVAINSVQGLRLTNMSAPAVIDYREDLKLDCQFDMGDEQLYAVKWYKDDHEFFRYMPHQQPHEVTFPLYGVTLVEEETRCGVTRCQLILTSLVKVKSGGAYKCEVSSEAPAFRLASETHNITVAAVAKSNPTIHGLNSSYLEGQIISATCLSSPSDPPQVITWYINREQAATNYLREMINKPADQEGLASTTQTIRFVVEPKYMPLKRIELTCSAAFPTAMNASAKRTTRILELFDPAAQINNQRYSYSGGSKPLNGWSFSWTIASIVLFVARR